MKPKTCPACLHDFSAHGAHGCSVSCFCHLTEATPIEGLKTRSLPKLRRSKAGYRQPPPPSEKTRRWNRLNQSSTAVLCHGCLKCLRRTERDGRVFFHLAKTYESHDPHACIRLNKEGVTKWDRLRRFLFIKQTGLDPGPPPDDFP